MKELRCVLRLRAGGALGAILRIKVQLASGEIEVDIFSDYPSELRCLIV